MPRPFSLDTPDIMELSCRLSRASGHLIFITTPFSMTARANRPAKLGWSRLSFHPLQDSTQ
jgi:hypothetical protein